VQLEKSDDLVGNGTRDLPACSIWPQPTTLSRVPQSSQTKCYLAARKREQQSSGDQLPKPYRKRSWVIDSRGRTPWMEDQALLTIGRWSWFDRYWRCPEIRIWNRNMRYVNMRLVDNCNGDRKTHIELWKDALTDLHSGSKRTLKWITVIWTHRNNSDRILWSFCSRGIKPLSPFLSHVAS
jgi:hypothetical protein